MPRWSVALVALLLVPEAGCSTCDAENGEPIPFADGLTNAEKSVYQTTTADAEFLHFPSGRRYDLLHGLDRTPAAVLTYLSFDPVPLGDGSHDSNVAEGAGNLVVIERQTDELIRVRNDTCSETYLRVVATTDAVPLDR